MGLIQVSGNISSSWIILFSTEMVIGCAHDLKSCLRLRSL